MVLSSCLMLLYTMFWGDVYLSILGLLMVLFSGLMMFSSECFIELDGLFWGDLVSQMLVCLSVYIGCLVLFSSMRVHWMSGFTAVVLSITLLLVLAFSVSSFFLFYVFFESVLFPTLVLILGWGYQPERLQAGSYMVVYTLVGSLPFLYGLSVLSSNGCSMEMSSLGALVGKSGCAFSWFYALAFLVKLPVYPFHLWLPKAHVEAPVAGSMVLAGLLLKLGGYGLLRFSSLVVFPVMDYSMVVVMSVSLWGGVLTSVMCLRQVDLKALVALSSVGHMGLVFLGIMSNSVVGVMGALLVMVGHGLCSSGLFVVVDVMAASSGSRLVLLNKGHMMVSPAFSLLCFLLSVSNMAGPPSLNFFGEVLVVMSAASISAWFLLLVSLMSFLSACYSYYFYVSTQHGKSSAHMKSWQGSSFLNYLVLALHWLPLNFLFLFLF